MTKADLGLIGLAVMGQNLVLNIADQGFSVAVYNRTSATTHSFAASCTDAQDVRPAGSLEEFVDELATPRRIILLVKAGDPVDATIDQLTPLLDPGDVIVDGGNSLYRDTERRAAALEGRGVLFVGAGVSGGEEGARTGPSIMPGGHEAAWPLVAPVLTAIAAKAGPAKDEPCCSWLGAGGAGHFVKMVHNGIEYGDMQVIAEAVTVLGAAGHSMSAIADIFQEWNGGRLASFLVEITASILTQLDDDGAPVVDKILDAAGQKGTGKWTVISAMELGVPLTLVAEAVGARLVSSNVERRVSASGVLDGPTVGRLELAVSDVEQAVYTAKLTSYAQGFELLAAASNEFGWGLDLAAVAKLWRGGCIIRADFLDDIARLYSADPDADHLLLDSAFAVEASQAQAGLRSTVAAAATRGVSVPSMASALAYYDGLRTARGSAWVIQAQRDYFGAHTYERLDRERGEWFHTDWAGTGAAAISGSYNS